MISQSHELTYYSLEDILFFEKAQETLQKLLNKKDHVNIWSNEYFRQIAKLGLGRKLRRDLPRDERRRFSIKTADNKNDKLKWVPDLLKYAKSQQLNYVVFVDDSPDNLLSASIITHNVINSRMGMNLTPLFIWVNNQAPNCDFSPYTTVQPVLPPTTITIRKFKEILSMRDKLFEEGTQSLWAIDWNNTICNTNQMQSRMHALKTKALLIGRR